MKDFETYMLAYWDKYPNERKRDYTIEQLSELIDSGAMYYLSEHIFIVYVETDDTIELLFYCADAGMHKPSVLKSVLCSHKRFMESINKPAYIKDINDLFKRSSLSEYNHDKKQWRLL